MFNKLINKKTLFFFLSYCFLIIIVMLGSVTLAKYTSKKNSTGNFNIGDKLYFNYERGDLLRNNQVIIGVPIVDYVTDDKGNIINEVRRIETMNVEPNDTITYNFSISNFNKTTNEQNGVKGIFRVSTTAMLSMPAFGGSNGNPEPKILSIKCTMTYRKISKDGTATPYKNLTDNLDIELPVYDENDDNSFMKYEFKVFIILDDQIEASSDDDYIDATSTIYLYIDATDKEN